MHYLRKVLQYWNAVLTKNKVKYVTGTIMRNISYFKEANDSPIFMKRNNLSLGEIYSIIIRRNHHKNLMRLYYNEFKSIQISTIKLLFLKELIAKKVE